MERKIFMAIFFALLLGAVADVQGVVTVGQKSVESESEMVEKLPEKAQVFVKHYFSAYQFAEFDKDKQGYRLYFVSLGCIKFNPAGEWSEIDGVAMQLPSDLKKELPQHAVSYMSENYNYSGMKKIVRNKDSFTVEFIYPKNAKLVFDTKGKLLSDTQAKPNTHLELSME